MRIGPVIVRWASAVKAEQVQAQAQRLDMRRSRCIAGQYHDIQALRGTVERWRPIIAMASRQRAKTPKGAGAAI